ncbi:MAG: hypothetical protein HY319_25660 [Armatimonadetes bacterium]|nr:hypothetical protein [Armatimonadota bacterium]
MQPARNTQSTRGGLLAEILISLGALIPVILVLAGLFPYSYWVGQSAHHRLDAHDIARTQLELARAADFSTLEDNEFSESRGGIDYRIVLDVSPAASRKQVVVTVTWGDAQPGERVALASSVPRWSQ